MQARTRAIAYFVLMCSCAASHASDFVVVPDTSGGFGAYAWGIGIGNAAAVKNPPLYLARGASYTFDIDGSSTHPFWFKTQPSTGSLHAYNTGLSGNDIIIAATITFNVPDSAPETLYYDCGNHLEMTGPIHIVVFRNGFD